MSQHDMNIANASFPAVRADLNLALAALVQNSSSATEPTTTFAYQFWADTTSGIFKQRNAANTAWISLFTIATGAWLGNAATVSVGDAASDTTTWPILAVSQTGDQAPATDAGLSYNASTNTLTVAQLSGNAYSASNGKAVGDLFIHLGNTAPAGSLIVPIAATNISRTTFAPLHSFVAALSYPWGSGDGSTTFGMPYIPANYALVQQSSGNLRTTTVGEVIAHVHKKASGTYGAAGGATFAPMVHSGGLGGALNTESTGGSANLAAGTRVLFCVQYL
jgi:hypothetical protein